jgi:hypothetical protein
MYYGERDEQYVDEWANKRVVGTTRYHCTDPGPNGEEHASRRDYEGCERAEHPQEDQCAEFKRRLRSGIGSGFDPDLR